MLSHTHLTVVKYQELWYKYHGYLSICVIFILIKTLLKSFESVEMIKKLLIFLLKFILANTCIALLLLFFLIDIMSTFCNSSQLEL